MKRQTKRRVAKRSTESIGLDLRSLEPSQGDGTAFAVIETNLDDGTRNSPPRGTESPPKVSKPRKPREISLDALDDWTDQQPWWVQLPMWQFVLGPAYGLRAVFWIFAMGFVMYFMTGGGAP